MASKRSSQWAFLASIYATLEQTYTTCGSGRSEEELSQGESLSWVMGYAIPERLISHLPCIDGSLIPNS